MPRTTTRSEELNLRLTTEAKRVLQSAAAAAHRSISEFVLESALTRAEETLPDRQRFGLTAQRWAAFSAGARRTAPPAATRGAAAARAKRVRAKKGMSDFRIEKLNRNHDVEDFDCGRDALSRFLIRFALQNQAAGAATTRERTGTANHMSRAPEVSVNGLLILTPAID